MTDDSRLPMTIAASHGWVSTLDQLASIPEEEIWLSKQKSARTRRAYRLDMQHFMRTLCAEPCRFSSVGSKTSQSRSRSA
jgi:hypothetical protein